MLIFYINIYVCIVFLIRPSSTGNTAADGVIYFVKRQNV